MFRFVYTSVSLCGLLLLLYHLLVPFYEFFPLPARLSVCPSVHPSVDDPVTQTLRLRGDAEGEWGFLYRSTLGSLMSGLSETMEVRGRCGMTREKCSHCTQHTTPWPCIYGGDFRFILGVFITLFAIALISSAKHYTIALNL